MDKDYYVFRRSYHSDPDADPEEDYVLCQEKRKRIRQVDLRLWNVDILDISKFLIDNHVRKILTLELPPEGYLGFLSSVSNSDTGEGGYENYYCLNQADIVEFRKEGLEVMVIHS